MSTNQRLSTLGAAIALFCLGCANDDDRTDVVGSGSSVESACAAVCDHLTECAQVPGGESGAPPVPAQSFEECTASCREDLESERDRIQPVAARAYDECLERAERAVTDWTCEHEFGGVSQLDCLGEVRDTEGCADPGLEDLAHTICEDEVQCSSESDLASCLDFVITDHEQEFRCLTPDALDARIRCGPSCAPTEFGCTFPALGDPCCGAGDSCGLADDGICDCLHAAWDASDCGLDR